MRSFEVCEQAKGIAEAGFIYGLPNVMNYAVMAIVTPNSDTPCSFAWMDLRAELVVLSVPAVDATRYYSVMLCDAHLPTVAAVGNTKPGGTCDHG